MLLSGDLGDICTLLVAKAHLVLQCTRVYQSHLNKPFSSVGQSKQACYADQSRLLTSCQKPDTLRKTFSLSTGRSWLYFDNSSLKRVLHVQGRNEQTRG